MHNTPCRLGPDLHEKAIGRREPVAALVSIEDLKALQKLEDATDVKRVRESIEDAREHDGTKPVGEFRKELEAKREE